MPVEIVQQRRKLLITWEREGRVVSARSLSGIHSTGGEAGLLQGQKGWEAQSMEQMPVGGQKWRCVTVAVLF